VQEQKGHFQMHYSTFCIRLSVLNLFWSVNFNRWKLNWNFAIAAFFRGFRYKVGLGSMHFASNAIVVLLATILSQNLLFLDTNLLEIFNWKNLSFQPIHSNRKI
jgi:hypothetical protein